MLFDTHCHLDRENCPDGPDAVLQRAGDAGVAYFVCIGVGGEPAMRDALEIAERDPRVFASVGVHPHDAAAFDRELEVAVRRYLTHPRVVAIGEAGLDYHYDHSPRDVQRRVFADMIGLAREAKKPLVVHTRDAASDTLEILAAERAADTGGIIHCFSEDRAFARRALDLGFDLSFSGIVTFKSATAIKDVAAWAPAERILLETDSPYLAPVPVRGRRCEPAFVVHTARYVAELRGTTLSALSGITTANAARRFGVELEPEARVDKN